MMLDVTKYHTTDIVDALLSSAKENKCTYSISALIMLKGLIFPAVLSCDVMAIREMTNCITTSKDITQDDFARLMRQCARLLEKSADNILDECATTEVYR